MKLSAPAHTRAMDWLNRYRAALDELIREPERVIAHEQAVRDFLVSRILEVTPSIERDWEHARETRPYWIEAAPRPRGNKPRGTGVPWIEVAEYTSLANITAGLARQLGDAVEFPGLPTGSDLRFAYDEYVVHLDAKASGPTDSFPEVVISPYQLSGNGAITNDGKLAPEPSIRNDALRYRGRGRSGRFLPGLPPLYTYRDRVRLCVTAFLKVTYGIRSLGDQPLDHMVLAIVPNGILLYDHDYAQTPGLLAAGKDERRMRVHFAPLLEIDRWRVTRFARRGSGWSASEWTP